MYFTKRLTVFNVYIFQRLYLLTLAPAALIFKQIMFSHPGDNKIDLRKQFPVISGQQRNDIRVGVDDQDVF